MSRPITNKIIDLCESTGSWEQIARECLCYMSEADVADMNNTAEFVADDSDEEEEE